LRLEYPGVGVPRIIDALATGHEAQADSRRLDPGHRLCVARGHGDQSARYANDAFAEYLMPAFTGIRSVEVPFVPEDDYRVNALGIRGLGELGNIGTASAVGTPWSTPRAAASVTCGFESRNIFERILSEERA